MNLIAEFSADTLYPFRLILPEREDTAFPDFPDLCTVLTQQYADFTVTLTLTPKLTTFPRWQPSQLNSYSFSWCANPETLSLRQSALIPSA